MINWFNIPDEGLSNGGLFEVKELEVTENGTYETKGEMYNKVTVNVEGGGSGGGDETTWNTVFEGSVTTTKDGDVYTGAFNTQVTANTIKVAFNGTEYTCEINDDGEFGAPFDDSTSTFNFNEYPFVIDGENGILTTQTAGTYTLKIEEPQSGGSSDFSKAILVNTEELEPNVSYRADKTVAEIFQAMNEGKMAFVDMGNKTCIVTNCNTVLKRIDASAVTFNTTSMGTTCAVSANASATAQFSSTDDYPVFVQQSV